MRAPLETAHAHAHLMHTHRCPESTHVPLPRGLSPWRPHTCGHISGSSEAHLGDICARASSWAPWSCLSLSSLSLVQAVPTVERVRLVTEGWSLVRPQQPSCTHSHSISWPFRAQTHAPAHQPGCIRMRMQMLRLGLDVSAFFGISLCLPPAVRGHFDAPLKRSQNVRSQRARHTQAMEEVWLGMPCRTSVG